LVGDGGQHDFVATVYSGITASKNGMFESQERGVLVLDEQANGKGGAPHVDTFHHAPPRQTQYDWTCGLPRVSGLMRCRSVEVLGRLR
jgi:hypothetical protein